MRVASIDIGTNTILLLIAEIDANSLKIIRQYGDVSSLGQNVDRDSEISVEAYQRAAIILSNIKKICLEEKVQKLHIVATSAMRDASNATLLTQRFKDLFEPDISTDIEVISGETEAALSFLGTVSSGDKSFVIDIGGGSTELIYGHQEKLIFSKSLPLGAVRLTDRYFSSQPPNKIDIENAHKAIQSELVKSKLAIENGNLYAVGGTATTIALSTLKLSDKEIEKSDGYVLKYDELSQVFDGYSRATNDEIIQKYNIHPRRAPFITAGSLILMTVMRHLSKKCITISAGGLRYGVLRKIYGV